MNLTKEIRDLALAEGFDLFGVSPATPLEQERQHLMDWLDKGYAGQMQYLARNIEKRLDPRKIMPTAESIICLGASYYYSDSSLRGGLSPTKHFASEQSIPLNARIRKANSKSGAGNNEIASPPARNDRKTRIARYAWGKDYHKVLKKKLKRLIWEIIQIAGPQTECKEYTDTGPLLERQLAARAGLGFLGKNTLLLHPKHGSYFFLAEILTNLKLEFTQPARNVMARCGSCQACIDACPTQAFPKPHELDATRCISYWTIEARGDIPEEFHEAIGDHAFGCDICQEVCPFNRRPLPSRCEEFAPWQGAGPVLNLASVLDMDETAFSQSFGHTPLTRAKHSGIIRNIMIVQKNLTDHQRASVPSPLEGEG